MNIKNIALLSCIAAFGNPLAAVAGDGNNATINATNEIKSATITEGSVSGSGYGVSVGQKKSSLAGSTEITNTGNKANITTVNRVENSTCTTVGTSGGSACSVRVTNGSASN